MSLSRRNQMISLRNLVLRLTTSSCVMISDRESTDIVGKSMLSCISSGTLQSTNWSAPLTIKKRCTTVISNMQKRGGNYLSKTLGTVWSQCCKRASITRKWARHGSKGYNWVKATWALPRRLSLTYQGSTNRWFKPTQRHRILISRTYHNPLYCKNHPFKTPPNNLPPRVPIISQGIWNVKAQSHLSDSSSRSWIPCQMYPSICRTISMREEDSKGI